MLYIRVNDQFFKVENQLYFESQSFASLRFMIFFFFFLNFGRCLRIFS